MKTILCLPLTVLLGLVPALVAQDAGQRPKPLRICWIGSSSLPLTLRTMTLRLIEATGKYQAATDEKEGPGYTRLDQFVTQAGLYESWCAKHLPAIEKGRYDYVVIQTIGWWGLSPEEQDRLLLKTLPALCQRIQRTGAQVILYDKYSDREHANEKDPRARTWVGRYPNGERFNYLLHVMAAKHAGLRKITFGGSAILDLLQDEHFAGLKYLFHGGSSAGGGGGHPGVMGNYMNACVLSYLMTGVDPVGNPLRKIDMGDWIQQAFRDEPQKGGQAFYDAQKGRIKDGFLELTDAEAKTLQQTAMNAHRQWDEILQANLSSDATFAKTMQEIRKIQGEVDKAEAYGLSPKAIAAMRQATAKKELAVSKERLSQLLTDIQTKPPKALMKACDKFAPLDQRKGIQQACILYWNQNNNKLRDDVFFQCRLYAEKVKKEGPPEEAERMARVTAWFEEIIAWPGYKVLLNKMAGEQQKAFLSMLRVTGPGKRRSPLLAAAVDKAMDHPETMIQVWDMYLRVLTDPNLLDRLKETRFADPTWLEVDKEFAKQLPDTKKTSGEQK
jgi:hypothetical protein